MKSIVCARFLRQLTFTFIVGQLLCSSAGAAPKRFMIETLVRGTALEGAPLTWSDERVVLLGRDGRLWDFSPDDAENYRKTTSYFVPYTQQEMRQRLELEFHNGMEVTSTSHYLVVHPAGEDEWAQRIEQMYREFVHNFGVRGISTHQPELPLVAIVFAQQETFVNYATREGARTTSGALGYYSPKTNRMAMFDFGGDKPKGDWRRNAATMIHEMAHQVAFNAGVHNRYGVTPTWLAEGLGTMFEARGVWAPQDYPNLADRINRGRLAQYKQYAASRHKPTTIQSLVASDRPFGQDINAAYAESWALTFYLAETQARAYAEYLKKTASRPDFAVYSPAQRTADFVAAFGDDWRMLDARVARFIDGLR
jgi:uncharacterized protein DUF1570